MNQSYDQKGNLIIIQIKDILASKKVVRLRKTSSQPSKDSLTKAHWNKNIYKNGSMLFF